MRLIFDKGVPGRRGVRLPEKDVSSKAGIPTEMLRRTSLELPEVTEPDAVRHFTRLSRKNFGLDSHFYPLGSCTMKYNPKIAEEVANYAGFAGLHPLLARLPQGEELSQGALAVICKLEGLLSEITGMAKFTLQPLAGAHGELTGLLLIAAYHQSRGEEREIVLVPDSAHGTNPASASLAGYRVVSVPSDKDGVMDFEKFKALLSEKVAAVMLTMPNTLGLFNSRIKEVVDEAHKVGTQVYYDGANLNAILGKCRPGDIGFDVVHLNLHKTFATPHGGGGPGAGPVGVAKHLIEFLPGEGVTETKGGRFALQKQRSHSIGKVAPFWGNFGVALKCYVYILLLGKEGLIEVAENAVLAANYLQEKLKHYYHLPYDRICMHECVFSAEKQLKKGVRALDIAKALIDRGFHPPTIYFPLIVKEALMIEPTETESKETLDDFIEAMIDIARLAEESPKVLKEAPVTTPVGRLNEAEAARKF